jgi:hypothetical protein
LTLDGKARPSEGSGGRASEGERELVGAERAAVVDEQATRGPAAEHRVLQHRQEGGGVLGEGEGGVGDDPRRVVDERDEVGLALLAIDSDGRAVHHVAHPEPTRGPTTVQVNAAMPWERESGARSAQMIAW